MKKLIELNIRYPKIVLLFITAFTFFSLSGFRNLYFDGSTEALMPKKDVHYLLGERAKKIYGDNKTFFLASIETTDGSDILNEKVFNHIIPLVTELEEFKKFNFELEDKRMDYLLKISGVKFTEKTQEKKSALQKQPSAMGKSLEEQMDSEIFEDQKSTPAVPAQNDLEKSLDEEIFEGKTADAPQAESGKQKEKQDNPNWDLSKPLANDFYTEPSRAGRDYLYDNYHEISLAKIKEGLDGAGKYQLDSIIYHKKITITDENAPLSLDTFQEILETWEFLYLYKSMEIIKTFMNPITSEDIVGTQEELKPVEFLEKDAGGNYLIPQTKEEWNIYRNKLYQNPAFEYGLFSSKDGSGNKSHKIEALALNMILRPQKDHTLISNYFFHTIQRYDGGGVSILQAGVPVLKIFIQEYMKRDLKIFLPIVILVVIFTFYLNFRVVRGVVLPSISVILGMIWTLGILGHFNIPVTTIVNILPPLLIAVGSSYSIHVFNQYMHDQKKMHREGKKAGLVLSMSYISLTVVLAAFTTFVGFLTLTTSEVTSMRHFGIFAAVGTLLSMGIAVTMIPAALSLMNLLPAGGASNEREHHNPVVMKAVNFISHLVVNHSRWVVFVTGGILVIFSLGLFGLYVETAPMFYFEKDSYVFRSDKKISENFHGSIALNLIIDSGKNGGAKDPEFLKFIEELRSFLTNEEGKNQYQQLHTIAFGDVIKRMHKAMNEDKMEYFVIPDERSVIEDYIQLYSGNDKDSDGRIDEWEQFVDRDFREVNVVVRTGTWKGNLLRTSMGKKGQERIADYLVSHPYGKKLTWRIVGETINFRVLSELVVSGQFQSIFLTIIIVGLIVFLLFQSIKAGILAIIPISGTIIVVYGFMGFLDIPLDIPKSMLAAIAIGIGVDDTIHVLKTLRANLNHSATMKDAIIAMHREAGLSVIYTSVALIFGFSVLMFSNFEPVFYLGWLMASTMVVTTIGALLLLPAVICFFKVDLRVKYTKGIFHWIHLDKFFENDSEIK